MTFLENLQTHLSKMLEYRKAAGYAAKTYVSMLTPFIDFCGRSYPEAEAVSREMVDAWLGSRRYSVNNQAVFISCLRQYTRFINFLGAQAFVPDDDYTVRKILYEPYSFTDSELAALFDSIDRFVPGMGENRHRSELVLPIIFRMMYCCGMRPGEPVRLMCEDVNLISGDIYIRQTKTHKDRHIIMSEDMRSLCARYDEKSGSRSHFFEYDGKPYTTRWVRKQFQRCWDRSGIPPHGKPRPYDLRHAFASRSLMKWIDQGLDVMALLPFLSSYMGHSDISGTLYYVHLLPDRLRKSSGIDWDQFSAIYGKGGGLDEN